MTPLDLLISCYQALFQMDAPVMSQPIKKGASGRTIIRLSSDIAPSVIAIHYTFERADNALHKPVSDLLEQQGVQVPQILYADLERQVLLVEDIGGTDFLSLKEEPWSVREPYYRAVLTQLAQIAQIAPPAGGEMMPPFTEETYRWEQDYFATHYVGTHLGKDALRFLEDERMCALASELGAHQPDLVHRDFQSQNLMLRDGEVYVIDFQGARPGYVEYDLASFIYDPYMKHPLSERMALRALWTEVSGRALDVSLIRRCALQRLMQALGAYGNIVHNQQNDWYAQHMEPASDMLLSLTAETEYEDLFHPLLKKSLAGVAS